MTPRTTVEQQIYIQWHQHWRKDWNAFATEVLGVHLDKDQRAIVTAVQNNKMVSVRSGTARGKDFVAAVVAMCFLYLTPTWAKTENGYELVGNTKIALTAPTGRQVENIMIPEIARLFERAKRRGFELPGKLRADGIRTDNKEWFLVGFKADENDHEAWSGFHAANVMFVVTEATGISKDTFEAIEGNLQGNSRLLLVFNPNKTTGYAADSQKSNRFVKIKLSSLTAPNVRLKRNIIPAQVDYEWVDERIKAWCMQIAPEDVRESENDFQWEGRWYRPSDLARKKILGEFPKTDDDVLIPQNWIELAQERWQTYKKTNGNHCIIGCDVAGMGRDSTCKAFRQDNYVWIQKRNSGGTANHAAEAGELVQYHKSHNGCVTAIDTIGEGAGVFSICEAEAKVNDEIETWHFISSKNSQKAEAKNGKPLTDVTGQYTFVNLRAYLFWCLRDWLNPDNETGAMLPPEGTFLEEATNTHWSFHPNGKIMIEPKEDIKTRIGYSPDEMDAVAMTFNPEAIEAFQTLEAQTYGQSHYMTNSEIADIVY